MTIDIGIGVVILIFALIGVASGFWGQILRLIALASLYFLAPPAARYIEGPVGDVMGSCQNPAVIRGTSVIVAAVGLYIIMSIVIAIILRLVRRGERISGGSRFGGFLLGAVKGGALAYLLLCGFDMVAEDADYATAVEDAKLAEWAEDSYLVKLVGDNNLLEQMGLEAPSPAEIQAYMAECTPDVIQNMAGEGTGAATPEAVPSGAPTPGAAQPGSVQPGTMQPGVVQPGTAQPGAVPVQPPPGK